MTVGTDRPAPAGAAAAPGTRDRRRSVADLGVAAAVLAWITVVLIADTGAGLGCQRLIGAGTWAMLIGLLVREAPLTRVQVGVVIGFASVVEYTFAAVLEVYVYRLDNVPAFVPPGHGLVYLGALALGRTVWMHRWCAPLVAGCATLGGTWAVWGIAVGRPDVLGAFWFACLLGFLRWGRSRTMYVAAFVVVSYLELLGTLLGTWTWQPHGPAGLVPIGNPPSGAAGGYGWFDLAALLLAPALLRVFYRARAWPGPPPS